MTVMLEVGIGLVFVYLVLSLLASALAEAAEHFLRYRASYLREGVKKLLLADDQDLVKLLYDHPMVKSVTTPTWWTKLGRSTDPTYIPSRQFALALIDVVAQKATAGTTGRPSSPAALLDAIDKSGSGVPKDLTTALRTLIADAGNDMEALKANVQQWFDGSMDAVAGWYKRRAQLVLLFIGIVIAVGVNADTLTIVNTLSTDSAVRAVVVAAAEKHVQTGQPQAEVGETTDKSAEPAGRTDGSAQPTPQPPPSPKQLAADVRGQVQSAVDQLGTLGLPVGWRQYNEAFDSPALSGKSEDETRTYLIQNRVLPTSQETAWDQFASHLLGWLMTAIAVSFGAPFWFDILNKVMVVRSTVKPREKSQEEGSEDRQLSRDPQTVKIEIAAARP